MTSVRALPFQEADRLRRQPFTYAEVGGTAAPYPTGYPPGYRLVRHRAVVGRGGDSFGAAAAALAAWRMHRAAGLRVATSGDAAPGTVVLLRLGFARFSLRIPCRVVYVVREPDRCGFAYGTLPGHPESGEERFEVSLEGDRVVLTVTAFSRAGIPLTRLAGPASWWVQGWALRRYAAGLRRLVGNGPPY